MSQALERKSVVGFNTAWDIFCREFSSRNSPALTNPSFNDVPHITQGKVFYQLGMSAISLFSNACELPATLTSILFKLEQIGVAPDEMLKRAIKSLTEQILWSIAGTDRRQPDREIMLHELVSVWRLFFQCKGINQDPLESISPEWNLPDRYLAGRDNRFGQRLARYHPGTIGSGVLHYSAITLFNLFDEVNQEVFRVPDSVREQASPFILLLTFILTDANVDSALRAGQVAFLPDDFRAAVCEQITSAPSQAAQLKAAQPEIFDRMAPQFPAKFPQVRSTAGIPPQLSPEAEAFYRLGIGRQYSPAKQDARRESSDRLGNARQFSPEKQDARRESSDRLGNARQLSAAEEPVEDESQSPYDFKVARSPEEKAQFKENSYREKIADLVNVQKHAPNLEKLWEEVKVAYAKTDQAQVQIPTGIYNMFLSGFMSLYRSEKTVEVWNHMIANGVKPEIRTWVSMLDGCANVKDVAGMNAIWERMLKTGQEPDDYAWTTRIHALISMHEDNAAFQAMDELGMKWLSAEKAIENLPRKGKKNRVPAPKVKPVNNFTKPNISVVNGAIGAFVDRPEKFLGFRKKVLYVQKVLAWGTNFSVKPDAYTYNALIKLYGRGGDHATMFKLLRQMEREGIEGDPATHSMLINAAFMNNKFDGLSESEQAHRIISLFDELKSSGLQLNTFVYSNAINRLLAMYGNAPAVLALLGHMRKEKINPGPQIYTNLVRHCFAQVPPAIDSVDALVVEIFSSSHMAKNAPLFDNIIIGYGNNDEVGKMMSMLARLSSYGQLPSWDALIAVTGALYRAGDLDRLHAVIRDVQMGTGVVQHGVHGGTPGLVQFRGHIKRMGSEFVDSFTTPLPESTENLQTEGNGEEDWESQSQDADVDTMSPETEQMYSQNEGDMQEGEYPNAEAEDEFVNAEHAGYLSDQPEQQQQHWRTGNHVDVDGTNRQASGTST
jgi:pentatricopeptide repeat protein